MTPPVPNFCRRCGQMPLVPADALGHWGPCRVQIYDGVLWVQCRLCAHWGPAPSVLQTWLRTLLGVGVEVE